MSQMSQIVEIYMCRIGLTLWTRYHKYIDALLYARTNSYIGLVRLGLYECRTRTHKVSIA